MTVSIFTRQLGSILAVVAVFSLFSCKEDFQQQVENISYNFTAAEIADLQTNTCLSVDPLESAGFDIFAVPTGADDRASGLKNKFWTPGQQIRVLFLNGSTTLQNRVFAAAEEWEKHANINFVKVASGTAEVRINFGAGGYWSYIGKDLVYVNASQPTMNLQFLDNVSDTELKRITVHEFGHTLGLRHEQQQPLANIPWNTTAVYAYYAQMGWSQQMVNDNVLNKNTAESSQNTVFDPTSIMQYPVPASLTTNGYSIGWNTVLSATDKSFIGKVYSSQRIKVRHAATGYTQNITFFIHGIYHTLKPNETLDVPALTGGNPLGIYEQPTTGGSWVWDNAYTANYGTKYKIVRVGSTNNLTLAVD
ncbi:MAG: matrixin family metalloprotease [Phycisphaerae bacterium]|nr:matrixin family metalloprotease [Saprospiraceae bacterium]